ncbi:MAG: hypothetical protein VKL59_23015, partial [Nostocaceae cyanobacterium]|nr:hypothetical protein [Nostocaceae cyanobacterium]
HELRPAGSELFQDSESYLNELNDQEVANAFGGDGSDVTSTVISIATQTISLKTVSVITEVKTPVSIFSKKY